MMDKKNIKENNCALESWILETHQSHLREI